MCKIGHKEANVIAWERHSEDQNQDRSVVYLFVYNSSHFLLIRFTHLSPLAGDCMV